MLKVVPPPAKVYRARRKDGELTKGGDKQGSQSPQQNLIFPLPFLSSEATSPGNVQGMRAKGWVEEKERRREVKFEKCGKVQ